MLYQTQSCWKYDKAPEIEANKMNERRILSPTTLAVRIGLMLAIALLAGLAAVTPTFAARLAEVAYTGCGGADAPIVNEAFEIRVVELVNQERADNGNLPPLKRVIALTSAARYHATDLGVDNYFEHDSYDRSGSNLDRVCDAFDRVGLWYQNWRSAAENIAAGHRTPEDVVKDWMSSSGHRSNILDPDFTEIGVGFYQGAGDYGTYWVQDFGVRRDVYPMVINGDSATTDDRDVDVYIHGSWSEMRLRNDSGGWGDWQPFASSFTWTINEGGGEHTISAELRTSAKSHTTCDKIQLTGAVIAAPAPVDAANQLYLPSVINDTPAPPVVACE